MSAPCTIRESIIRTTTTTIVVLLTLLLIFLRTLRPLRCNFPSTILASHRARRHSGLSYSKTQTIPSRKWLATDTFTIVNTDTPPASSYTITPASPQLNENQGTATFTITRTNSSQAETVYVSTVHDQGSPNPNGNYYYDGLLNQPVTFAAGASTQQVQIRINDLGLASGSETFRIIVKQNYTDAITNFLATDTFTIVNNDAGIVANASVK